MIFGIQENSDYFPVLHFLSIALAASSAKLTNISYFSYQHRNSPYSGS
ncbi:hypothetical protein VL20_4783 [Microcystis panniformis FACHB-1757]|uniref:Uncharacterized protein n=1 Tax=Microcystis panniformis FACHB-1757 TaxID=1638788 RepID=A0A0K1S6C4_9CHRO|nr:hypothetical protein VL20_4783 [Microcystis panniformis FACHB-1757]